MPLLGDEGARWAAEAIATALGSGPAAVLPSAGLLQELALWQVLPSCRLRPLLRCHIRHREASALNWLQWPMLWPGPNSANGRQYLKALNVINNPYNPYNTLPHLLRVLNQGSPLFAPNVANEPKVWIQRPLTVGAWLWPTACLRYCRRPPSARIRPFPRPSKS